ncbi:MAG: hypothetical protein ACOYI3_05645, partial [Christensenellales bacterium]
MQDNQFTSFPSDRQEYHHREPRGRFSLGSLFATGFLCFVLGALACVVALMATGILPVGAQTAYEAVVTPRPNHGGVLPQAPERTPAPSVTPALPDQTPGAEPEASAALETPAAPRNELPVPDLGSLTPPAIDRENLIASIFEQASPSVCGVSSRIHVYSEVTRRNNEEETSTGTGIILTADGYIVTNNNIIEG